MTCLPVRRSYVCLSAGPTCESLGYPRRVSRSELPAASVTIQPAARPLVEVPGLDATVCPYLRADAGSWRYARPSREHRCTALAPPTILAIEKQRRLCLVSKHGACPTFLAARSASPGASADRRPLVDDRADDRAAVTRWRFTRTAALVIDDGRIAVTIVAAVRRRGLGQATLVVLLLAAFAAVGFSRLSQPGVALAPTASPSASPVATVSATPGLTVAPSVAATPEITPESTPAPSSPVATPSTSGDTYVVQSGDTLSGIAARFGTTVSVLQELNGIVDAGRIRVGQVLTLP